MTDIKALVVEFDLEKHPNADTLSIATVRYTEWQCVVKTSDFDDVKLGIYIPIDAQVPTKNADGTLTQFAFLDKKENGAPARIKTIRLRQALSQGLLIAAPEGAKLDDDFTEALGVERYEPPLNGAGIKAGKARRRPGSFHKYSSSTNRKSCPRVLQEGEIVRACEKIHGSQLSIAYIHDGKYVKVSLLKRFWNFIIGNNKIKPAPILEFFVSSHNVVKDPVVKNDYTDMAEVLSAENKLKPLLEKYNAKINFIVFGELYGYKVQNLAYGCKPGEKKFAVFDVLINDKYQPWEVVEEVATVLGTHTVPLLYRGPFSHEKVLELQDGKTVLGRGEHIREGVVVTAEPERRDRKIGRVTVKYVSDAYLEKQGKDPKATDGH